MLIKLDKLALLIIKGTIGAVALLTVLFWGQWLTIVAVWALAAPAALIVSLVISFVLNLLGARIADTDDVEAEDTEFEREVSLDEIQKSEEIVGRYQDKDIHEWLQVDNPEKPNEKIKLFWHSVVDPFSFVPPKDLIWLVLMPGLLYCEPENTELAT